jgi:hypothetical protein
MTACPPVEAIGKPVTLCAITEHYTAAVEAMELAWAKCKASRDCPRCQTRYVRALRRCDRLRAELNHHMEKGTL